MRSLAEIAERGDDLETLKALRQRLASAIDNTNSGRDLATLSRQLQLTLKKIAELDAKRPSAEGGETVLDRIRRSHAERQRKEE